MSSREVSFQVVVQPSGAAATAAWVPTSATGGSLRIRLVGEASEGRGQQEHFDRFRGEEPLVGDEMGDRDLRVCGLQA